MFSVEIARSLLLIPKCIEELASHRAVDLCLAFPPVRLAGMQGEAELKWQANRNRGDAGQDSREWLLVFNLFCPWLRIRDVGLAPRSGLLRPTRGGGQVVKVPPHVEHSSKINRRCKGSGLEEFYTPNPVDEEGRGVLLKGWHDRSHLNLNMTSMSALMTRHSDCALQMSATGTARRSWGTGRRRWRDG